MAGSTRSSAVVVDLQRGLERHATPERRQWWTRYLKGTASFRGVAMGDVRREVRRLWQAELRSWPPADAKRLAVELLHLEHTEDKLAGVLLLAEHLLDEVGVDDLPLLEAPLADGAIADWSACDWYAVKVLAPLCARDGATFAAPLAAWSSSGPLWRRRAPAAAFATIAGGPAPFDAFDELCLGVCRDLVRDPERFAQTAVGWLLRELSKREPELVAGFVEAEGERLSREARRMALAKIEGRGRR